MNEEEQESLEILKGLEFEEYDWYVKTDKIEGHANDVVEKVEKAMKTILNLIDKQQKQIKILKDNLVEDDIEGHRIAYVDTPEFEENYISKDKIKEKIEFYKKYGKIKNSDEYVMSDEIEALEELLVSGQESDQEGGQEDE